MILIYHIPLCTIIFNLYDCISPILSTILQTLYKLNYQYYTNNNHTLCCQIMSITIQVFYGYYNFFCDIIHVHYIVIFLIYYPLNYLS